MNRGLHCHKKEPQAGYAPWGLGSLLPHLGFWAGRHNVGGWGAARPGLIERHIPICRANSTDSEWRCLPRSCRAKSVLRLFAPSNGPPISRTIRRWSGNKSVFFLPSRVLRLSYFSWSIGSHMPRGLRRGGRLRRVVTGHF